MGTGLEARVQRETLALLIVAEEDGTVENVDGFKIVVAAKANPLNKKTYALKKFMRSNAGTCINQTPLCNVGDEIKAGRYHR